jgi:uncharacterized membrane protein HdeD (DUF308 family)
MPAQASAPPSSGLPLGQLHLVGLDVIGKKSGWLLGLGIVLIVLGMIAIGSSVSMTLVSMVFVGSLMLVGGILQTLHAIVMRTWSGFFLDLLSGVLYTVVGALIIGHPGSTAIALTLMIAICLILSGVFRIVTAITVNYQNRLWIGLNGAVNLLLAYAILSDWPLSGLWVIGLFIGIDMLFNGWSLVMLSFVAKKLNSSGSAPQGT